MSKKLISQCPVCGGALALTQLSCTACETRIQTQLAIPAAFRLPEELQQFVLTFLRCRGNIREVEKEMGISYPTVCKRLELVNELLGNRATPAVDRDKVLSQVEAGEITAQEAAQLLKGG
jgi:hypothetical protein